MSGSYSKSGVYLANDFRDNLIIDRYHPVLSRMRLKKRKDMCSENSEDVLTWNVFCSLRQIDPRTWLAKLFETSFGVPYAGDLDDLTIRLWPKVSPPPSYPKDEGDSEIDVILESSNAVWFIEAKYKSDISPGTTNDTERNQILRNIDLGTHYAGRRDFHFSLLVLDEKHSSRGIQLLHKYQDQPDVLRAELSHRLGGLTNLHGLGFLYWSQLATIILKATESADSVEKSYAVGALAWLVTKGINPR